MVVVVGKQQEGMNRLVGLVAVVGWWGEMIGGGPER